MMSNQCQKEDEMDTCMQEEIEVTEKDGIAATTTFSSASISSSSPPQPSDSRQQQATEKRHALLALLAIESPPITNTRRPTQPTAPPISTSTNGPPTVLPINNSDRTKMCSWYYEMSSFLKISPGTASRAMSLLDRFMDSSCPQAVTASKYRDEYQLAALTALFVAIKLYDRLNIMPCHVSYLSRGRYTSDEVIRMELAMLHGLEWRVTKPSKLDYANLILDWVGPQLTVMGQTNVVEGIRDLTGLQIQLSDFYAVYSQSMQSMVALAAAMNAYEVKKNKLAESDRMVFRRVFGELLERYPREAVYEIMDKLCRLVDPSFSERAKVNNALSSPNASSSSNRTAHTSPASSANIYSSCEESSLETFDAALETMENINFENWLPQHFLCCGSIPLSPDSVMEGDAARDQPNNSATSNHMDMGRHCDKDESMDLSPGGIGDSHSFDSRGSVKVKKCQGVNASKQSPTSIANMLFGISS